MTSTSSTTSSSRTGRGERSRRRQLSPAQREAADAVRAAKIAALHEQIGEHVEQLTADPQWRAMLDATAKFHTYSLGNQLLIELQAARLGISPTRVAGFGTAGASPSLTGFSVLSAASRWSRMRRAAAVTVAAAPRTTSVSPADHAATYGTV